MKLKRWFNLQVSLHSGASTCCTALRYTIMPQLFLCCKTKNWRLIRAPISILTVETSTYLPNPVSLGPTATQHEADYSEYPPRTISVHYRGNQHQQINGRRVSLSNRAVEGVVRVKDKEKAKRESQKENEMESCYHVIGCH